MNKIQPWRGECGLALDSRDEWMISAASARALRAGEYWLAARDDARQPITMHARPGDVADVGIDGAMVRVEVLEVGGMVRLPGIGYAARDIRVGVAS